MLASFIYKSNLVEGVSGVYNVAAKKPYTDMELAKTIISRTGSSSKIINEMTECNTGIHSWDISILKAKEHFGYVPEYDLYQMIDWVL